MDGLFIHQIWRPALNALFHCGPYEVKASKFLSFFALAASLLFNQPSRRQKMAPPSASTPSLRQVSGFFGRGGGGPGPRSCLPSSSPGGRAAQGAMCLPGPSLLPPHFWVQLHRSPPPRNTRHIRSRDARGDLGQPGAAASRALTLGGPAAPCATAGRSPPGPTQPSLS